MPRGVVKRVVDGDTIEIRNGERVRIANVDAPEMNKPGGEAAKRRLQKLLPRGTSVGLSDPVNYSYGRSVRKVTKNGKDIKKGLGQARPKRR